MSVASDIRTRVSALWSLHPPLFVSRQPEKPDRAITFYDAGGQGNLDEDRNLFASLLQVRCRSRDYNEACADAEFVRFLLENSNPSDFYVGSIRYVVVYSTSDILDLGYDDKERHEVSINFAVIRQIQNSG